MTSKIITLSPGSGRSQIPHGVQDRFPAEAARRRQAEGVVRECFARWGYQEVIPPTFEFYENLSIGASAELQEAMYRFLDQKGRTLALRADFTPQMARMSATKLYDQPMPLRCSYMGSLYRYEEPQAGRKREFTQAGIELIGADTAEADAEVVALAIAALEALELNSFQVNLGQMAFFRCLTHGLPEETVVAVRDAIDHKNQARLLEALDQAGLIGNRASLLKRLPALIGGPEVLEEARNLSANLHDDAGLHPDAGTSTALERFSEVYRLLQAYGVADRVILDLSEVRGMDYYTGITFRGVAPGLGWPVLSGGRYDELIARFGRPLAAIGFGIGIERALLIQSHQGAPVPSHGPQLLVHGCDHAECLALLRRLREQGYRVELDVLRLGGTTLIDQARQRGIQRVLRCCGDRWRLWDGESERDVTGEAVLQEAETWASSGDRGRVPG
jgi:ATP phosphoribosyltransferase regulatory subunit